MKIKSARGLANLFSLLVLTTCCIQNSSAQAPDELAASLTALIDAHDGEVAVCVRHLDKDVSFEYQAGKVMPTASLIKLPIMVETYRQVHEGKLNLDMLIDVRKEDQVPGSGILTKHFGAGSKLTLRDAIRLMIAYSDNTATNLVVDQIGLAATADTMNQLGYPETKLHSRVYRGSETIFPERSKAYGLGSTTAADIVSLLRRIHNKEVISPAACEAMLEHLSNCESTSQMPRLLPQGVRVAHKSGAVSNARCDAGIIYAKHGPIAICTLTNNNADHSWTDDNAAELLNARIAKTVFDYFNPDSELSPAAKTLRLGDFGLLVESLQRTLNAKMESSPNLSIDGDYGPATQAAVVSFQSASELEATGIVEETTWKALSPLITDRVPVPDPELVNKAALAVLPADESEGRPFVGCSAWAVAEMESGEILGGLQMEQPLDIASTTKIMTAFLVLRKAADEPEVLNEVVTFSRRADRTRGSTSGVQEGESLPVSELLYGLMLPSGNDASVALAEHFGGRLVAQQPGDSSDSADPLEQFVAAMNAAATELNLINTSFRNPHGLTQTGHLSTAADLLNLTRAALAIPKFRHYISTRQRGCTLTGSGGYTRNVVWENTNKLLEIDGYAGVKTGTTDKAGACLVSLSNRGDRELLLVVLGAASSTGRYVDSRNLFRWAWQQR